jgi:hypothetical protein
MITFVLKWAAKRTHNIQAQAAFALLFGLVSIFGIKGTILIVMQLRKLKQRRKPTNANLQQTR